MALTFKIGQCSLTSHDDPEQNEDTVDVQRWPELTLCQLADGDSWDDDSGRLSSRRTVEFIREEVHLRLPRFLERDQARLAVGEALLQASNQLRALSATCRMGLGACSVVLAWPGGTEVYLGNLGDCRAYLKREEEIELLTVDGTLAEAMQAIRQLSPEEVNTYRRVLYTFVGSSEVKKAPDVHVVSIQAGDKILLSSDGLHEYVSAAEILGHLRDHCTPQVCADALCRKAIANGSRDDVSCIVIYVQAG